MKTIKYDIDETTNTLVVHETVAGVGPYPKEREAMFNETWDRGIGEFTIIFDDETWKRCFWLQQVLIHNENGKASVVSGYTGEGHK